MSTQTMEERRTVRQGETAVCIWPRGQMEGGGVVVYKDYYIRDAGYVYKNARINWPALGASDRETTALYISALERALEIAAELDRDYPEGSLYAPGA